MKNVRRIAVAMGLSLVVLSSCAGDDLPTESDTRWIQTVDPVTGTRLSCFMADGSYALTMHCIEVQP